MKKHLGFFFTTLFIACYVSGYAQQRIFVVTKTISKEYNIYTNPELKIKGEKSDIFISGWKNKSVKIEVQLISRNPKKDKAEQDLKYLKYELNRTGGTISLSNSFISDKNARISSNLSMKYSIWIPDNTLIMIENLYGEIHIENVSFQGDIQNSFGEVYMNKIKGKSELDLYYADTRLTNINAKMICKAVNSQLHFDNASGDYEISSNYGNVSFSPGDYLQSLLVKSTRTEVNVHVSNIEKYSYKLATQNSDLKVPVNYAERIKKESRIYRFDLNTNSLNPTIQIETTYCPITINTTKP